MHDLDSNKFTRRMLLGTGLGVSVSSLLGCICPALNSPSSQSTNRRSSIEVLDPLYTLCSDDNHLFTSLAHLYGLNLVELDNGQEVRHGTLLLTFNNHGTKTRRVSASISMEPYASEATFDIEVPPQTGRFLGVTQRFDFERLYALSTTTPAVIEMTITPEGGSPQSFTDTVLLEPVNRIAWAMPFQGEMLDMRKFVVALVTPADREGLVHKLIKDASQRLKPPIMNGYQSGDTAIVRLQLEVLYETLQARGYNYTSISEGFFEGIQRVRPACVSLKHNTGNCIEGTLVFASALEALGMQPSIAFTPGHAFLSLAVAPGSQSTFFLETTMLGSGSFEEAMAAGAKHFTEANEAGVIHFVDVQAMRTWRVPPVGL